MQSYLASLSKHFSAWTWKTFTLIGVAVTVSLLALSTTWSVYSNPRMRPNFQSSWEHANLKYASPRETSRERPAFCNDFDTSKIAISIKTGATEPRNKIPMQLLTFLRCVEDVHLFSDLEGTMGSHGIADTLGHFSEEETKYNPDFQLYRQQREYVEEGREVELESLSTIPIPYKDWRTAGKNAAWGLDKYKFLSMINQAGTLQPGKNWYVFIEADTYLSISNLLRFLETRDPAEKSYFGNPVRMWEHPEPLMFGHGGSGFILSGATMRAFTASYSKIAAKFDAKRISEWWYGDFVTADALDEELDVTITDARPMINSDEPALLPFDEKVWCKPVMTLHHMDTRRFDEMYQFQKSRNFSALLFRDVYAATYQGGIPMKGTSWDNLSDDERFRLQLQDNDLTRIDGGSTDETLRDPNASFKACREACVQHGHCYQFAYITRMKQQDDGTLNASPECHLSRVFRLGREARLDLHAEGTKWESGWMTERIEKFIADHQDCNDVDFGKI